MEESGDEMIGDFSISLDMRTLPKCRGEKSGDVDPCAEQIGFAQDHVSHHGQIETGDPDRVFQHAGDRVVLQKCQEAVLEREFPEE